MDEKKYWDVRYVALTGDIGSRQLVSAETPEEAATKWASTGHYKSTVVSVVTHDNERYRITYDTGGSTVVEIKPTPARLLKQLRVKP